MYMVFLKPALLRMLVVAVGATSGIFLLTKKKGDPSSAATKTPLEGHS
jgi:hypothetical protein